MNKNKEAQLKQEIMQLASQKKYAEAKDIAFKLSRTLPKDIEVWFALAQLQEHLGEFELAVRSYYQVCQGPSPRYAVAVEKAVVLCWRNNFIKLGLVPARELIRLKPKSAEAFFYMGFFWFESRHYLTAEPYLVKAAQLDPKDATYQSYCGQLNTYIGRPEKAIVYYEKGQKLKADAHSVFTSSIMTHNYADSISDECVFEVHRSFGESIEHEFIKNNAMVHLKVPRPKRLKVAYVSADFRAHSVSYFAKAIVESYSKENFEVICYSDVEKPDAVTEYFQGVSEHWCEVYGMSDEELYKQIIDDQVDILVDLIGLTGSIRLGVFARRAAPVQVTYLGYPNTTGLSRMDYRITDNWSDPEGQTDKFYTESLKRLPGGFLCYTPASDAPDVSALPALKEGAKGVCFGSFNSFTKLSPKLIKLWVKLLLAIPHSTLYCKAQPLGEKALCEWLWGEFEKEGVDRKRVLLQGWEFKISSHLEQYSKVDIHLDSYPYNGTTTICESLWQGVPVISLAGSSHRSRVGLSLLTQVGLESYIAHNEDEYISIATEKASSLEELAGLREVLRERVRESSLMDRSRFIGELESTYEQMWEEKSLK